MAKRRQITVYLNSRDDSWGNRTVLSTYKSELADIHFLEDEDGKGFHYYVNWAFNSYDWDEKCFDTELEAVKHVCRKVLTDKYYIVRLRHGLYWNSEEGAITGWQDGVIYIDLANTTILEAIQSYEKAENVEVIREDYNYNRGNLVEVVVMAKVEKANRVYGMRWDPQQEKFEVLRKYEQ